MRFRRGVILYGAVVAGGLLVGFGLPDLSFLHFDASPDPAAVAAGSSSSVAHAGDPSEGPVAASDLAEDGAESPELRALRMTELSLMTHGPIVDPTDGVASGSDQPCQGAACGTPENTEWMSGLRMPDLPIHPDAKVERFVNYFTKNNDGRKLFRALLQRSGRYRGIVEPALHDKMLPRDLMALVAVESGFSPTALSTAGASGLWQFMPDTARAYGLAVEADYDERRSVTRATEAGTRLLADLYDKFGSWELALAAYNMGYKGMLNVVRDTGSNDFWTLSKITGALPEESVMYVPKIMAVALILNNLERFGFDDVHYDPPIPTGNLEVPAGVGLTVVARAAGTSVQRLRELNPELLADTIPNRGESFVTHVPGEGLARARAMLPRLLDVDDRDGLEHSVSRSFDWGRDELPRDGYAVRDDGPPELRKPRRFLGSSSGDGASGAPQTVFYRIGSSETLAEVARMFGTTPEEIASANYLDPSAKLQKGMMLTINGSPEAMERMARRRAPARLERQEPVEISPPPPRQPQATREQPRDQVREVAREPSREESRPVARPRTHVVTARADARAASPEHRSHAGD
jgi:membrane-bound lytic murein transglycosylase D